MSFGLQFISLLLTATVFAYAPPRLQLGARLCDPLRKAFLAADPLGHESDMALNTAFKQNPGFYFDADGRFGKAGLKEAEGAAGWVNDTALNLVAGGGMAMNWALGVATELTGGNPSQFYGQMEEWKSHLSPSAQAGVYNPDSPTAKVANVGVMFVNPESMIGKVGTVERAVFNEINTTERALAAEGLATGTDEAVFWSGIGRGGADRAATWAGQNGGATLESTLASRGTTLPVWDASNPASVAAWRQASTDFAAGARGNVRVLQGDSLRVDAIWRDEFRALQANPNVNSIRAINPNSGAEVLLWP